MNSLKRTVPTRCGETQFATAATELGTGLMTGASVRASSSSRSRSERRAARIIREQKRKIAELEQMIEILSAATSFFARDNHPRHH
ncbi:hypothetical protein ACQP1O_22530 [Nocardia sp. CA-151230]|uniref:hypothetical protein n=1 Tax=Nocardia sp. CA-151230 TaxID=3239982 RepID=UPI003D89EBF9